MPSMTDLNARPADAGGAGLAVVPAREIIISRPVRALSRRRDPPPSARAQNYRHPVPRAQWRRALVTTIAGNLLPQNARRGLR